MKDYKIEIADYIIFGMENLSQEDIDKLKNQIIIVLDNYEIREKEKSLIIYEGKESEFLLKKFLVTKKVQGCTDRTLKMYKDSISKILKVLNKPIREVTSDDIVLYLANRAIKDNVSKTTQDNELRFLRTFFSFLVMEDYIIKNPCLKIKAIKAPKKKKKAFKEIEIEKLRLACKNTKEKALIELLLSTGCRAAETVSIKITDIENDRITILGKGQKERVVYLNAKAQIAIQMYLKDRTDNNPWLFPKIIGKGNPDWRLAKDVSDSEPTNLDYPNYAVNKIGKRVGVRAHTHKFRRTCATLALRRGMPLLQVSKMLGHADVATTQIYLDISEEELEQAHRKYVV